MQYCPKCKVHIRGNKKCCPLCQGQLDGTPEAPAFGYISSKPVSSLSFMKVATFITVIIEMCFIVMYFLSNFTFQWIPFVMIAVFCVLADCGIAMYYRNNLIRVFHVEFYIGMLAAYISDRMTGCHGWSVTWMIPFTFLGLAVATRIIAKAVKLQLVDYIIYVIVDSSLSLLQIIPILRGLNKVPLPALLIISVLVIYAAAVIIFRSRDLKNAGSKWLNL